MEEKILTVSLKDLMSDSKSYLDKNIARTHKNRLLQEDISLAKLLCPTING